MSTIVHPREPNVILFNVWNHLIQHKEEIAWAAVFGLVFAVILDILGPDSRIRTAIRHFRNRWAEHSVSLLTKRIRQLQDYQKQLTDVRWIYLFAFQNLFLILLLFGIAATCMVMAITLPFVPHPSVISRLRGITLFCLSVGTGFAAGALRQVFRDTPEKVQAEIRKIGLEIEGLQEKLRKHSSPS